MASHVPPNSAELVIGLMERSAYGPLAPVFVLLAVAKYAERLASAPADAFVSLDGLVPGHAWHGVAVEIHEQLKGMLPGRG